MTTPQTQSSPPLPPTMPVLTGRDICRGALVDDKGRRCLLGWAVHCKRLTPLIAALCQVLLVRDSLEIVGFNNDPRNSEANIAAVWNAMPPLLGYVLSPDKSHFILPAPTTGEEKQR